MNKLAFALIASIGFACAAHAAAPLTVTGPWARATVPQMKSSGAFMVLQSPVDARLVAASTPAAARAELHQMEMKGDMMKMEQVDAIELPAGKPVNLASGGYHVMLMDLKRQLKAGDTIALTLVVEGRDKKRSSTTIQVPVKLLNHTAPGMHQ
jgi:copper(I)-binding protein